MKAEDNSEDNTALVLRGATYEEALELINHIDVEGLSIPEMEVLLDPILKKYGWSVHKCILETILRKGIE